MVTEALVARIKQILAMAKGGNVEEAYKAYAALFRSAEFRSYPPEEQRGAIKLVVNVKVPPAHPTAAQVDAFKAAIDPMKDILGGSGSPEDFQWLGICQMVVGNEKEASELFRTGLKIERDRNPQSDLCGSLMKWVAAV